MDEQTIQKINREALKAAKEHDKAQRQMYSYLVAGLSVVIFFFAFRYFQPDLLKSKDSNGDLVLDNTRVVLASVAGGLVVLLGYQYLF